jgi:pimeloyl-ACP methyl ester carboxylesterase
MMSSSGYQRVNGLKLWVHRFREASVPPSGLTILLVHGFLDAGATWDLVAPALARGGHDVVAPDLRGFGQSDFVGPGGYYHFPDYVADIAELVDALAPRRLAIVGHSMGGAVAAFYAGSNHERVERLALLEGMGPNATEPAIAIDRMQAWLRTLREVTRMPKPLTSLQEAVERLSLHHPRVPREVIETRARLLTRADDTGRLVWAYDPLHRTTAPTPFHAEAFKEFLRRIECPTLVVSGGPAGWHPPDEAERVACLPHVTRFDLPSAGHMMHWTEPDALGARLAAFFGEQAPAQKTRAPASGRPAAMPAMPPPPPSGSGYEPGHPARPAGPTPGPIYAGAAAEPAVAPTPFRAHPEPIPPTLNRVPIAVPPDAAPAGQTTAPATGFPRQGGG